MRMVLSLLVSLTITLPAVADGRPMTIDELLRVKSVSDPQLSPDGKLVAYVVSEIDRAANKSNSDIWLVPVSGGEPKKLTSSPGADSHPRWSPDGKLIAFTSARSGSSQIWLLPIDGGEAHQLTKLPIDVDGPIWSPIGDKIAFVASVIPGKSPEETAKSEKEKGEKKSKARIYDSLMIRHWTAWDEGTRSHLFVCDAKSGEAKDLIPGWKANVPPGPFGGSEEYAWSPDGTELAFTSEPLKDHATTTNTDIWTVPATGGEPKNRTEANKGADGQPQYCINGSVLAYVSQARPGFEADLWVVKVLDLNGESGSKPAALTADWDRPVQSFKVEGSRPPLLRAVIDDAGTLAIVAMGFSVSKDANGLEPKNRGKFVRQVTGGVNTSYAGTSNTGEMIFLHGDSTRPAEVFAAKTEGKDIRALTHHNADLLAKLDVQKAESFTFKGAGGDDVSGWMLKPPGFDPSKKYPVLFLIHGGPQGAWHDEWHARWNYQLFASPGYVVVAINPRGSTGYGQAFTDAISKDWNGKVYEDLMKGLDHALATNPFLDGDRMAAAGGSYGGYMVNWILGHSDRFKCLVSHAGVYDLSAMAGTTEELWFADWEFGGPPWTSEEVDRRHLDQSPSRYVANFKTPTLILHGALDFRVPEGQGMALFTGLQRKGVPSRLVLFPDEGHWILKPGNREVWWRETHNWLKKYLKP